MSVPVEGKLTLASRLAELPRAEQAIINAATGQGFDERDQFAIKLAVEEALVNAIKHGNASDPGKKVHVEFCVDSGTFRISIQDEGSGFHPDYVADPTLDENLEKPNGRGVMLMRVYMDEVRFNATGNRVSMVKRRCFSDSGADADAASS